MSNAAVRDAIAKSVNRTLRIEGVVRVDQLLRSYRRLVSLLIEHDHISTDSELLKLVRLRIAARRGAESAPLAPEAPPVVEAPVEAKPKAERKKRAPRKAKTAA